MTFSARDLKKEAADRLQASQNQKDIVLLYAAVTLGVSCLCTLLQFLLSSQISHTGGLAGMSTRSFFSALSSFLPILSAIVTMCMSFGYLGGMVRISRGQYASRNALKTGYERFWPLLRLKLLLSAILLGFALCASYLASFLFLLSPFSDRFMSAVSPAISSGSLLSGGSIVLDESTLDALYAASGPLIVIFAVVILAVLVPVLYRYRMADYILYDHPEAGALYALRESRKMTRGSRLGLFKLDLSLWWYYALTLLCAVLSYGDVLLSLAGISLPIGDTACFTLFYVLSLAANFALLYFLRNRVEVTYALAYGQLKPKEQPQSGVVLGNIFQM